MLRNVETRGPLLARDERHVAAFGSSNRFERLGVIVSVARNHDKGFARFSFAQIDDPGKTIGFGKLVGVAFRRHDRDAKPERLRETHHRFGDRQMTDDNEMGFGQVRLQVDIQRSSAGTGFRRREMDDIGLARLQHTPRLILYRGPRAAPANPANPVSFGGNDGFRAGLRRSRLLGPNDRGKDERLPGSPQPESGLQDVRCGHSSSAAPFSLSTCHTRLGVMGISMCRTPRCHIASTTAFTIAGGAPTVADSPTPLAPIG